MKYYVTADVHGYFTELKTALAAQGFFEDTKPHKLVICGDLFDRGTESLLLQEFILDLLSKDQVILIRGNHEDLALDLLHNWSRKSYLQRHHNFNGTVDTVSQLTGFSARDVFTKPEEVGKAFLQDPFIQTIIPAMVDYFEIEHSAKICLVFSTKIALLYVYRIIWRKKVRIEKQAHLSLGHSNLKTIMC